MTEEQNFNHRARNQNCIKYEPAHEIMALFVLRKFILQTSMCCYPVGLDVWFLVESFIYFHTLCVWIALGRLHRCAGSPEPTLVAYVISTIISLAGSYYFCIGYRKQDD